MNDTVLTLNGDWSLYYAENRTVKTLSQSIYTAGELNALNFSRVSATVPGNFELDFQRAGIIPEPFFGRNPLMLQRFENLHLWYCKVFDFCGVPDSNTFFLFEGIDTVAEIYLNGECIGKVSNMFIPHEIPASKLRCGKNELMVHIIPSVIAARDFDVPASSTAHREGFESLYIRKAAHMYGWDIMPRIISGGIWKGVSVIQKKQDRIENLFCYTSFITDDYDGASVQISYTLRTEHDFMSDLRLHIRGVCGDSVFETTDYPMHTNGRIGIWVQAPKLWWPRNAGEQNLYSLTVELLCDGVVLDSEQLRFGIRTVGLSRTSVTDDDGNGDFCLLINHKRIFAMGTNWVPLDAFHSRDEQRLDRALAMAEDLGCNIIRLWGGNVYESDRFYDFCDEKGILVWQDFCMGSAVYPQEQRFLDILAPEIIYTVKRLRNHASLAIWAGDNECDVTSIWSLGNDPNTNIITRKFLPQLLQAHDFTRPFLPSSPYVDEEAYKTGKPLSEEHLWGPRDYFKAPYYVNSVCHFASETGYHGCPSVESIKKFISPEQLWPFIREDGYIEPDWIVHASSATDSQYAEYASRIRLFTNHVKTLYTSFPDNLWDFAFMSQISQAEAKKYLIEKFRITRGRRNGIIWWNMLDGWPQISDAVVDYYFTKKLAYHYIKRSQQPILLAFDEPDIENRLVLYGINDITDDVTVRFCVKNITTDMLISEGECVLPHEKSTPVASVTILPDEQSFLLIEYTVIVGDKQYDSKNHYFTNCRRVDYPSYRASLEKCGMAELEGF